MAKVMRSWTARANPAGAKKYAAYFENTLAPELEDIDGFEGAFVLTREVDGAIEITVETLWSSMDAIREFAGADPARAVVEDEARACLESFDETVVHRKILFDTGAD